MWDNYTFVSDELKAFESYITGKFPPRNGFLNNVSQEVILSGGKRLRPALVILCGMMNSYSREKVFPIAAAIETLHTATLIHDDIIDNAKTRRGQPTISEKHGINLAVYTGDYLLASSVLLLSEAGLPLDKLNYVAKAARAICAGEVDQYFGRHKLTSVNGYLRRVIKKTGILFSASCILGAAASGCSDKQVNILGRFGLHLGVAFQIRDDLIDIESNEVMAGKPVANDIREGIATLPFLFAASRSEILKKRIEEFFEGIGEAKELMLDVLKSGGNDDSKQLKHRYVEKCRKLLNILPQNESINIMGDVLNWL